MSLLVPVLTAAQKRVASGFSRPKVALRASRSERMAETITAAPLSMTGTGFSAASPAAIFSLLHCPPLASVR